MFNHPHQTGRQHLCNKIIKDSYAADGFFPEGAISFQSASPFDTVAPTSMAQNLAIDNLQVVAAPELSSLTVFALGQGCSACPCTPAAVLRPCL